MFSDITIVLPAYNEEKNIGGVIKKLKKYFGYVLVVDDNSKDNTSIIASKNGAKVITNQCKNGYIGAIKTGFENSNTKWIGTMDVDGEHRVVDMKNLYEFACENDYDLIIGSRSKSHIYRSSEKVLSLIAYIKSPVFDTGSGMKIIKRNLSEKMQLFGKCICGTFVLEALYLGAKIGEFPIYLNNLKKPSNIAWFHLPQLFILLKMIIKGKKYYGKKHS